MRPSSRRSTARASSGLTRREGIEKDVRRCVSKQTEAPEHARERRQQEHEIEVAVAEDLFQHEGAIRLRAEVLVSDTTTRPASTNAAPEVFPAPWMTPLTTPKRSHAWRTADVICLLSAESALTISTSDPSASICISLRIFRLTESSWAAESRCPTMSAGKFGAPGQHQPRLRLLRKCLGNLQPDVPETSGGSGRRRACARSEPARAAAAERRLIELLHEPPSGAMRHHWLRRSWTSSSTIRPTAAASSPRSPISIDLHCRFEYSCGSTLQAPSSVLFDGQMRSPSATTMEFGRDNGDLHRGRHVLLVECLCKKDEAVETGGLVQVECLRPGFSGPRPHGSTGEARDRAAPHLHAAP